MGYDTNCRRLETPQTPDVAVAGRMDRSIADFIRACSVHLVEQQENISPDNALIAVLCDAVRLAREHLARLAETPQTENVGAETPQTPDRLRELAMVAAIEYHNISIHAERDGGHRTNSIHTCPHPDCKLVRSVGGAGTGDVSNG